MDSDKEIPNNMRSCTPSPDEIDIYSYLPVLWQKKLLIFILFILFTSIYVIWTLNKSKVYDASCVINVTNLSIDNNQYFIENPEIVASNITQGFFNNSIVNSLHLYHSQLPGNVISAINTKGSPDIKISYTARDSSEGIRVLNELFKQLNAYYGHNIPLKLLNDISLKKRQIERDIEQAELAHNERVMYFTILSLLVHKNKLLYEKVSTSTTIDRRAKLNTNEVSTSLSPVDIDNKSISFSKAKKGTSNLSEPVKHQYDRDMEAKYNVLLRHSEKLLNDRIELLREFLDSIQEAENKLSNQSFFTLAIEPSVSDITSRFSWKSFIMISLIAFLMSCIISVMVHSIVLKKHLLIRN